MANTLTVAQYKAAVRNRLDDESYDDTKLLQYLNDANREVCNSNRWRFMEEAFIGTVTSGTSSYALPTGFQSAINFVLTDPDNNATYLGYLPFEQWDHLYPDPSSYPTGSPHLWTFFGNQLIIGPAAPDQAYTMQLRYLKAPTTLTVDTDLLDVPDEFMELVVLSVYKRCLQTNDNFGQAQVIDGEVMRQTAAMSDRLQTRQYGEAVRMGTGRT